MIMHNNWIKGVESKFYRIKELGYYSSFDPHYYVNEQEQYLYYELTDPTLSVRMFLYYDFIYSNTNPYTKVHASHCTHSQSNSCSPVLYHSYRVICDSGTVQKISYSISFGSFHLYNQNTHQFYTQFGPLYFSFFSSLVD